MVWVVQQQAILANADTEINIQPISRLFLSVSLHKGDRSIGLDDLETPSVSLSENGCAHVCGWFPNLVLMSFGGILLATEDLKPIDCLSAQNLLEFNARKLVGGTTPKLSHQDLSRRIS